jgi:hypothetical protein
VTKQSLLLQEIASLLSIAAQKQNAQLAPLDSSFRWNDEDDTPIIPGKAASRDPESRRRKLNSRLRGNDGAPCFC